MIGTQEDALETISDVKIPDLSGYNLIFITIDTLRYDHLGHNGYGKNVSPFLDELAGHSVIFDNAFASTSHTAPSHASMFTSLELPQHQLSTNGQKLSSDIPTLAESFRSAGYDTGGFVAVRFLKGLSGGFKKFDTGNQLSSRKADLVVGSALKWVNNKDIKDPFFIWVHLFDVHNGPRTEKNYDTRISFVDNQIRRLFEDLSVRHPKTLWVITSDHGEGLGDHGYLGHGRYIYNEQLHIPLIFHFPSEIAPPDKRVSSLVRHIDLFPTIVELFRLDTPEGNLNWKGRSINDLIFGGGDEVKEFVFSMRRPKYDDVPKDWEEDIIFCIQDLDEKYIFRSQYRDEYYDLVNDPLELNNLILDDALKAAILKEQALGYYRAILANITVEVDDPIDPETIMELKQLGYM